MLRAQSPAALAAAHQAEALETQDGAFLAESFGIEVEHPPVS